MVRAKFGAIIVLLTLSALAACTPADAVDLGDIYTNDVLPGVNGTYDLGSPTYQWQNAYIQNLWVADNASLQTLDGSTIGASPDLSGYVPYTGATTNLVLGSHNFGLTGYVDLVAIANPAAPAAGTARFHAATTQGFTRFEEDNEAATNLVLGRDNVFIAKNTSGSDITKGQVVRVTGSTGNVPNIGLAKGDSASTLPAIGIALDTIGNNNFGQVMKLGILASFNTSAFSTGDQVWVSTTTAGALQNTRPASPNYVQRVGSVLVDGVGNGSLLITIAPFIGGQETGTNASAYTFASKVYINDTSNAGLTTGLTINQGAADDIIFGLKSSDVATGSTSVPGFTTETDDYYVVRKRAVDNGGVIIATLMENVAQTVVHQVQVYGGQADTTKSTAGRGLVEFYITQHDGSNAKADIAADGNIYAIRARVGGSDLERFILDEDGDLWLSGGITLGSSALAPSGYYVGTVSTNNLIDDASNGAGSTTHYIGNASIDVTVSDSRLKTNQTGVTGSKTPFVLGLANYLTEYDYLPDQNLPGRWLGFEAQTLYEYAPQFVIKPETDTRIEKRAVGVVASPNPDYDPLLGVSDNNTPTIPTTVYDDVVVNNTWSIRYQYMVPYLLQVIKEQDERITKLEATLGIK